MQKTPKLIAHLNTLGVADVELKNNNVVKIHFQQGVSQKTWSKKELTDICTAFCAGSNTRPTLMAPNPTDAKIISMLSGREATNRAEMEKQPCNPNELESVKGLQNNQEHINALKAQTGRLG